jgi:tRNA dimethylallyltransferase
MVKSGAPSLVVVCGPTASGKTSLALRLAEQFPSEVVSADSRQVYRDMDIGTAKPSSDELARVPHHLIDIVRPDQAFNANKFAELAHQAVTGIHQRQKLPLVVGGTGLYLQVLVSGLLDVPGPDEALRERLRLEEEQQGPGSLYRRLQQLDPAMAERLQPRDQVRIIRALEVHAATGQSLAALQQQHNFSANRFRVLWLGLAVERQQLYRIIEERVEAMFAKGLVDEVRGLIAQGYSPDLKAFKTIGYREVISFLKGELSLEQAIAAVKLNSRRYAKRQMTWFRRNPEIIWVDSCREFAKITELMKCFRA